MHLIGKIDLLLHAKYNLAQFIDKDIVGPF